MAFLPTPPKKEEPRRGGLLGIYDTATRQNASSGLNPLQELAAGLDAMIMPEMRMGGAIRQQGASNVARNKKNSTVEMLRTQGRADLADAVERGTIDFAQAFGVMQSEKAADTAFGRKKDLAAYQAGLKGTAAPKTYEFQALTAALMRADPSLSQAEALKMAISKNKSNVIVNTGDSSMYGKAPEGSVWAKGVDGQHVMEETAPGSGVFRPKILPLEGSNPETRAAKLEETRRKNTGLADGAFDAITLIDDIYNDAALPDVTGMLQGRAPALTQDGTDLVEKIDQLKGKAFLQAFETLKGGGQITEREGLAATKAIARLERKQSPEAYRESLMALRSVVERVRARALGQEIPEYSDEEFQALLSGFQPAIQNSNTSTQKTKTGVSFTIINEGGE